MRAVEPDKLSLNEYTRLIDGIYAKAFMANMETPPEDREDISQDIYEVLRDLWGEDETKIRLLYNTMRAEGSYKNQYDFLRYGYIYWADEDFFNKYYEDCCANEIIEDIRSEGYDDEKYVAVGKDPSYFDPSLCFRDELCDFIDIDDLAESIRDKWKDMHKGEEDVSED